ncbi:MAG: VWA domain-containing protein [Mesorhizobium sp.]
MTPLLPQAADALLGFARVLRWHGFTVAPEQSVAFLQGVELLGPRHMKDIEGAALATLACPPDRRGEFDTLFRAYFWGDEELAAAGEPEDETTVKDAVGGNEPPPSPEGERQSGAIASATERLAGRALKPGEDRLTAFAAALPYALPRRRSFRSQRVRLGGQPDIRRSLRATLANDGDVPAPMLRRRAEVQRPLLLLIDVSGSMKQHTNDYLRVAYAVVQTADRAEVFTLGTRLTRITPALRLRDRAMALERASALVDDWDGGTRLGPALQAFLSVPRFGAFARGAAVVLLSDGLERGGHAELESALKRISARAYRLSLCTPLAADPRFRPQTAAMQAILPHLDDLVDGSGIEPLTDFILSLARRAERALTHWNKVS